MIMISRPASTGQAVMISEASAATSGEPDRRRWNARYDGFPASFAPHPLAVAALSLPLPAGPVLDLASGPSGSALAAATAGRQVTAVDVSDVALAMLAAEAARRGVAGQIDLVHADLTDWQPEPGRFALVLCTGYWDRGVFGRAAAAVAAGGLLGWQALTEAARQARPALPEAWCLAPGEPAALLPCGFAVIEQAGPPQAAEPAAWRRMLARRAGGPGQRRPG